ncbi:putative transcription elongation factor SPT5 homolog 1 isoform X2 [Brassica rapa]|uniref:putative transcription elongation factor SPT5 homolog 1 isoform X2 n=1 Tax=Brassica campestris TaxID=3711 RepID=UPI00142E7792|nr:putative transcription elongation factor SPT5 homolog 1 isoform X2 [Brassica rapa]XP_033134989.1 putative transcription elongation factor SPT5 homolog 1 isoform X2 [Brassica rapa]
MQLNELLTIIVYAVDRNAISDNVSVTTPSRDISRYSMGSETPMHPSRTPLHPYMTPMRDSGASPIHDGMRTPMRDRAWNPYTPMSPPRDNWDKKEIQDRGERVLNINREVLLHGHMKHRLLAQDGLVLPVVVTQMQGRPEIMVRPMLMPQVHTYHLHLDNP